MLKASGDTHRRFSYLIGSLVLVLGGMAVGGYVQRTVIAPPDPPGPTYDPAVALQRYRRVSNQLRELATRHAWKEIAALAEEDCAEGEPCDGTIRFARFEAWMRMGEVEKALQDRVRLGFERNVGGKAFLLAIEDKREDYLAQTKALLKDADPEKMEAVQANNLAWMCLMMPDAVSLPDKVLALARKGAEGARGEDLPNFLNTLGVALYRTGRDAEAIQTFDRSDRMYGNPYNHVFLAMAHHRLGHKEEATAYAESFREHMDESFGRTEASRQEKVLFLRELNATMPTLKKSAP